MPPFRTTQNKRKRGKVELNKVLGGVNIKEGALRLKEESRGIATLKGPVIRKDQRAMTKSRSQGAQYQILLRNQSLDERVKGADSVL